MPRGELGQQISFAIVVDEDTKYEQFTYHNVTAGARTIRAIAAKLFARPELSRRIADLNDIRDVNRALSIGRRLRVPGEVRKKDVVHVYADNAPRVSNGYARYDTIDRPERKGLNHFMGYDPIEIEIPVRFEADRGNGSFWNRDGKAVEDSIERLERMAGRGNFKGAGTGPPPVIAISTTGPSDTQNWLIPSNYQVSRNNPTAPYYRISAIEWDATPLRDFNGNRIRQLATVTVKEHVSTIKIPRSVSTRASSKRYAIYSDVTRGYGRRTR